MECVLDNFQFFVNIISLYDNIAVSTKIVIFDYYSLKCHNAPGVLNLHQIEKNSQRHQINQGKAFKMDTQQSYLKY